jgi:acetyl esterase/lipase
MFNPRRPHMLHNSRATPWLFCFLLVVSAPMARAGQEKRPADAVPELVSLEGAENHLGIRYLPDDRYTGDPGLRKDYELTLNLYLPPGPGPHPMVYFAHGGSYTFGHKDELSKPMAAMFKTLIDRGFAVANVNYILKPKRIDPQLFWDMHDMLRFLRKESKRYRLDPTRFGAFGVSAGGWLITAAGCAHGDLVLDTGESIAAMAKETQTPMSRNGGSIQKLGAFMYLGQNPNPAWPGYIGSIQALNFDFMTKSMIANAGPTAPATLQSVGTDYIPKEVELFRTLGVPYELAILTDPKFKGKGTHGPPWDGKALTADGRGETVLIDRIAVFFETHLGPKARTPAPEINPGMRFTLKPVEVSMVTADPTITVHYTTDGSDPGTASPVYNKPFTVAPGTEVKAMGVMPGRPASGIATATFVQAAPPPRIISPNVLRLPDGEVGKPYQVAFASDETKPVLWAMGGELLAFEAGDMKEDKLTIRHGFTFDRSTGVLAGTPNRAGTFAIGVHVGRAPRQIGSVRNYLLTVRGNPGGPDDAGPAKADDNVEVATVAWSGAQVETALAHLRGLGLTPVSQEFNGMYLWLVPAAQRERAAKALGEFAAGKRLPPPAAR